VGERRQALANFGNTGVVEIGDDNARPFHFSVKDFTPRVNDHTVAVRHPAVFMAPPCPTASR
jgi:hypothetical protein